MKAAQINGYGGKDVLKTVDDVPRPQVVQGQILVEVYAAGVNPFDIKVREGHARQMKELELPATLGGDFAGKVAEVGEGVTNISAGDEVYGQADALSGEGSYAEFTPVAADSLALKPKTLDFASAAAIPLAGASAYQALVDHVRLQQGQKVLIHGGAGGIGSFALQLAKYIGAYVATTVAPQDFDFVKNLGADEVINYKTQDFSSLLSNFDAVYDTVGGDTTKKSYQVLKPGGLLVSMVAQEDEKLSQKHNVRFVSQFTRVTTERLNSISKLVDSGAIKVQVDKVFPLEEAAEALSYIQSGNQRGKVVIKIK